MRAWGGIALIDLARHEHLPIYKAALDMTSARVVSAYALKPGQGLVRLPPHDLAPKFL